LLGDVFFREKEFWHDIKRLVARVLLYLMERDAAVGLLRGG